MMQQPLPDLPPLAAAGAMPIQGHEPLPAAATDRQGPPMRSFQPSGTPVGKRLRQMVTVLASGGFVLTLGVGALEVVAKPEFRPTTLLATMEGRTELSVMNQRMGVEPGKVAFTEADYRAKLAEAERSGQAKAELAYQRDLAGVQADKDRVVQAYATLYQRTNMIAQGAIQLESVAQQFRQRLLEMSNGGRAAVLSVQDGLCAFGNQNACEAARKLRAEMISESSQLTEGDVAAKIQKLMTGIDDPATFVTHEDRTRNGIPHLDR